MQTNEKEEKCNQFDKNYQIFTLQIKYKILHFTYKSLRKNNDRKLRQPTTLKNAHHQKKIRKKIFIVLDSTNMENIFTWREMNFFLSFSILITHQREKLYSLQHSKKYGFKKNIIHKNKFITTIFHILVMTQLEH